jgi:hypothetical protein
MDVNIPEVPTIKPSLSEFKDFRNFVDKLFRDPKYKNYGAVKVIPPVSPSKNSYDENSFIKER